MLYSIRKATEADRDVYVKCLGDKKWRLLYGVTWKEESVTEKISRFAPLNSYDLKPYILEKNFEKVGFANCFFNSNDSVEIGGGILPQFLNNGTGIIFYINFMEILFQIQDIKRLEAIVAIDNQISNRMHESLGFNISKKTNDKIYYVMTEKNFYNQKKTALYKWCLKKFVR